MALAVVSPKLCEMFHEAV